MIPWCLRLIRPVRSIFVKLTLVIETSVTLHTFSLNNRLETWSKITFFEHQKMLIKLCAFFQNCYGSFLRWCSALYFPFMLLLQLRKSDLTNSNSNTVVMSLYLVNVRSDSSSVGGVIKLERWQKQPSMLHTSLATWMKLWIKVALMFSVSVTEQVSLLPCPNCVMCVSVRLYVRLIFWMWAPNDGLSGWNRLN